MRKARAATRQLRLSASRTRASLSRRSCDIRTVMTASHFFPRFAFFGFSTLSIASAIVACSSTSSTPSQSVTPDAATFDAAVADSGYTSTDGSVEAKVVVADLSADFSIAANPNGRWTYGYLPYTATLGNGDSGTLTVFPAVLNNHGWYDPSNAVLDAPAVWRNDTDAGMIFTDPGEVALHPGSANEYAVSRWTAPSAGTYSISLQFKAGDQGDTNGFLLRNGVAIVTEDSTSTNAVHELDVTLAEGDILDVVVGSKGDFYYDTTPVHFTIRK